MLTSKRFLKTSEQADQQYSADVLDEAFRYGLTAGLVPSPEVYHADRIGDHPHEVFSPEAVAAWGDMETLLDFYNAQVLSANDPRYKYGMVRVSGEQPNWIPADAGLVDHLFLLFGLVESLNPNFFADRVIPALEPGDYNADGSVDLADYNLWKSSFGSTTICPRMATTTTASMPATIRSGGTTIRVGERANRSECPSRARSSCRHRCYC